MWPRNGILLYWNIPLWSGHGSRMPFSALMPSQSAGKRTLARRIQVASDLAALCKLRQPSRRGKPFNWNKEEKTANDAILQRECEDIKTSPPMSPVSPRPSADQCPFCFFEEGLSPEDPMRPYARIDSLRRHVLRI